MSEEVQFQTDRESGIREWCSLLLEQARACVMYFPCLIPTVFYLSRDGTQLHALRLDFTNQANMESNRRVIVEAAKTLDADAAMFLCEGETTESEDSPNGEGGKIIRKYDCLTALVQWRGPENSEGGYFGGGFLYGDAKIDLNSDGDRVCSAFSLDTVEEPLLTGAIRRLLPTAPPLAALPLLSEPEGHSEP